MSGWVGGEGLYKLLVLAWRNRFDEPAFWCDFDPVAVNEVRDDTEPVRHIVVQWQYTVNKLSCSTYALCITACIHTCAIHMYACVQFIQDERALAHLLAEVSQSLPDK